MCRLCGLLGKLGVLVGNVQQGEGTLGWAVTNVWVGTERPVEESLILFGLRSHDLGDL